MEPLVKCTVPFCAVLSLVLAGQAAVARGTIQSSSTSGPASASTTVTLESVTSLNCKADVMEVRVNVTELRWLYNDTKPAYLSLLDESCNGTMIGDIWTVHNAHSQCYTQRKIDQDWVQYQNALIYKEHGSGPIVRHHRWRLDLNCRFNRHLQVGMGYALTQMKNYEIHLNSEYAAEIHLYNDSSLQTELKPNQVRARLEEDLYVKIDLKGDWNVHMHLQKCVARPAPLSLTSYTLIQDGCPTDSETFIVYATRNSTLIHFKVFEFYAGSSTVYVKCDVAYCAPGDNAPRCGAHCP